MKFKNIIAAASVALLSFGAAAKAAPVDVDLVFVIDSSGSMGNEFTNLGDRSGQVLTGIGADAGVDTVQAGLVTYETTPTFQQSLTDDATVLEAAFNAVSTSGGTENAGAAVSSVLPGGSLSAQVGWRNNTVKSVVLITDESGNDQSDYASVGAALDAALYLNNVIALNELVYEPMTRPKEAFFDLDDFRADPDTFIQDFISVKISELTSGPVIPGTNVIPLPATAWMLIAGVGGLVAMKRSKKAA